MNNVNELSIPAAQGSVSPLAEWMEETPALEINCSVFYLYFQRLHHALLLEQWHKLCCWFCYLFSSWIYGLWTRRAHCRSCRIRWVPKADFWVNKNAQRLRPEFTVCGWDDSMEKLLQEEFWTIFVAIHLCVIKMNVAVHRTKLMNSGSHKLHKVSPAEFPECCLAEINSVVSVNPHLHSTFFQWDRLKSTNIYSFWKKKMKKDIKEKKLQCLMRNQKGT